MIDIRDYREGSEAGEVGSLIADTYSEFNLGFAAAPENDLFLGPFLDAPADNELFGKALAAIPGVYHRSFLPIAFSAP